MRRELGVATSVVLVAAMAVALPVAAQQPPEPLRVCADPDNFPQSRADGSGFKNEGDCIQYVITGK